MTRLSELYYYNIESVLSLIKNRNARNVLLQIPEGLKALTYSLVDELRSKLPAVEVNIDLTPTYGSCLIDSDVTSYYDLVINLGHEKYPYWSPPSNVYFIDLLYKKPLNDSVVGELISKIREFGDRVALYTTSQHKHEVKKLAKTLSSNGISVVSKLSRAVILGCWFSDLDTILNIVDAIVVVSGGYFHSIGVGLRTQNSKPVIKVDPYEQRVELINSKVYEILKLRYGKVMKAYDARRWLLVSGTNGQYRPNIISKLKDLLHDNSIEYYVLKTALLTENILKDADTSDIDVVVVTSCPRLPIEDLSRYHKPVLTPGEALMILKGRISDYIFPW